MKSFTFLSTISQLAVLALLLPAGMLAAQNSDSPAITKLLERVKSHAALAEDDAHSLEAFTRSGLHHSAHSVQLNQMKEHVNNLILDGNQMSSMRDEGSPWQQDAIDHIQSLLPEMSAHLTTLINHFNDNRNQLNMKPYRDLVLTNQTLIGNAREIIADYVTYSEAKARADDLEKKLQMSPTSEPGS